MKETTLQVQYRKADELVPYVNNAKRHEPAQIARIAASIKEFGFTNPILLDGDNGVIAGHGRLLAAQKLGMVTVPTIELSHLSGAQKRAYVLADNRLGEVGTSWDMDLVVIELESLAEDGFDIELTGFGENELKIGMEEEPASPGDFKEYGDDIDTDHECPKCGYRWSGSKN